MAHECIFLLVITKLEKLLISEVSGVDDPANMLPGFMVAKASDLKAGRGIGPDESWDVAAAEKRIREITKATAGPNPAYASCFLWYDDIAKDENGDGVPDSFGDYKFLVCDVVDKAVKVMPAAIRAASNRASGASIPASDKGELTKAITALEEKAGIGEAEDAPAAEQSATSIVTKIRDLLGLGHASTEGEFDMTEDRLNEILDERLTAFAKGLVERLTKSEEEAPEAEAAPEAAAAEAEASEEDKGEEQAEEAEVPAEEEAPEESAAEAETEVEKDAADEDAPAYLTAEALTEALGPYNQILEKVLERLNGVEQGLTSSARKSLDGQEGVEPVEKAEDAQSETVADAIVKAFRR